MAAAAFTATLIFQGMSTGQPKHVRCTISDVAAAYWIYPDGSNVLTMPSSEGWKLVDVIIVTGGTDTTQSQLFVNQLNSGVVIDHKSNLNTSNFRQFATLPLTFAPGSQIKLVQAA